jgi:hypothetical protein
LQAPILWIALLALAAIFIGVGGYAGPTDRSLRVELSAEQGGGLQVFFDKGQGFSERDSTRTNYPAGGGVAVLEFPQEKVRSLRLDFDQGVQDVLIKRAYIDVPRSEQANVLDLGKMRPLNEVKSLTATARGAVVVMAPGAKDSQLLLTIEDSGHATDLLWYFMRAIQLFLLATATIWIIRRIAQSPTHMPVHALLFGVWLLSAALAMAAVTSHSVHPDEFNHVAAARYYFGNWLPPSVDDPRIVESYSIYGTSYLNELDIVYLIAAKATLLWSGLGLSDLLSLRLFNVMLLGILLLVAWTQKHVWAGMLVLLMSPQIWYVFSYFNADAFPLFLSIVLALLAAPNDSPISRFVQGGEVRLTALAIFVVALGLLLISKRNYLPVVLIVGMLLCMRHLGMRTWCAILAAAGVALILFRVVAGPDLVYMFPLTARFFAPAGMTMLAAAGIHSLYKVVRTPDLWTPFARIALLFGMALLVALPRIGADYRANGAPTQKHISMSKAAEHYADKRFKPSTLTLNPSESYPGLHLAAKGAGFDQVFNQPYGWAGNSWRSFLGVYGYMNIFAPAPIYLMLSLCWVVLMVAAVLFSGKNRVARRALILASVGISLVALSSLVHSWANDFQPQGRYLFPGIAMIAIFLLDQPQLARTRLISYGVILAYFVGLVSFIGFAMPQLTNG